MMGDNRDAVVRLAGVRADQPLDDHRPRLREDVAVQPLRLSVAAVATPIRRRSRPCDRADRSRCRRRACAAPRADGAPPARPTRTRARRSGGTARRGPRSSRCGACSSRRCRGCSGRTRGARAGCEMCSRRCECTSRAAVAVRCAASSRTSGVHTQSRSVAPAASATTSIGVDDRRVLDVDRELVVGAQLRVDVGEAGNAVARPARPRSRDEHLPAPQAAARRCASWTRTTSPSPGEPGVALEAPHAGLEGPPEGRDRVLRLLEPGATVSEGDRLHRRHPLTPGELAPLLAHAALKAPLRSAE